MKFRQFEFRLFQKIRGRRKKKQKYPDTAISIDDNCNYTRPAAGCYDNAAIDYAACTSTYSDQPGVGEAAYSFESPLSVSAGFNNYFYAYNDLLPLSELNIAVAPQCHYENCHACNLYDSQVLSSSNGGVPIICLSEAEDTPLGTPHTIPKTRSRIKTNPWLPSPRTTPSASPTGTVESVLFGSSDLVSSLQAGYNYNFIQKECDKLNNLINIGDRETGSDEAEPEDGTTLARYTFPGYSEENANRTAEETSVVETIEIVGGVNYHISFQYEEEMDDLLENSNIPRDDTFLSIKDLIEDDVDPCIKEPTGEKEAMNEKDTDTSSSSSRNETRDISPCDVNQISKSMTSEEDDVMSHKDLTFFDECYMQESIDTGYASVTREDDLNSDSEFESIDDDYEWDNEPCTQSLCFEVNFRRRPQYDTVSESGDTVLQKKAKRRSRSLADIELSLDEKVTQLREEKLLVQRKILEAQEEEQIRRKQLKRFQAQPILNRKEVLLQTLQDLKVRLESQSSRLQSSYETVIAMQRRYSKRRSTLPFIETQL